MKLSRRELRHWYQVIAMIEEKPKWIVLAADEQRRFVELLPNPTAPTPAMEWAREAQDGVCSKAVFAMMVEAKDDQAEAFCRHHGFMAVVADQRLIVLSLISGGYLASS